MWLWELWLVVPSTTPSPEALEHGNLKSNTMCLNWFRNETSIFFTVQHIMISYMHNSIKPYKTLLSHNLFFLKAPWKTFPPLKIVRLFFPITNRIKTSSVGHHNGPTNTDRLLENQQRQENTTGCWFAGGGGVPHRFFNTYPPRDGYLFLEIFCFPTEQEYPKPKIFPKKCGILLVGKTNPTKMFKEGWAPSP